MSQIKCEYCGCTEESCLAQCAKTGLFFCNGKGDCPSSHIVNHLKKMHLNVIGLPDSNPFKGHCPFRCYVCGKTDIFQLGFLTNSNGIVYIACKNPCQFDKILVENHIDNSTFCPIVDDDQIIPDVVAIPTSDQYHKVTISHILAVTEGIKAQLQPTPNPSTQSKEEEDDGPPGMNLQSNSQQDSNETPSSNESISNTNNFKPQQKKDTFSEKYPKSKSCRDVYNNVPQFCDIMSRFVELEREENQKINSTKDFHNIQPFWIQPDQCSFRAQTALYKSSSLGTTISFSQGEDINETGTVININRDMTITIQFPRPSSFFNKGPVSAAIVFNSLPFERESKALQIFRTDTKSMHPVISSALLGNIAFLDHNQIHFKTNPPQIAELPNEYFSPLNASQIKCIRTALSQRFTMIQGPPGTGKTTVIAALALSFVRAGIRPILVCSQSNVATDFATKRCAQTGVNVIRVLSSSREQIGSDIYQFTTKAHVQNLYGGSGNKQMTQQEISIVKGADVVCTTCTSAGGARIRGAAPFPVVIFDESGQCVDPDLLIPLVNGAKQAILVGDHKQLGPIILSNAARFGKYDLPLMQRLILSGVKPVILRMQYRMHPALSEFPNKAFYGNKLTDGVTEQQRAAPPFIQWPNPNIPMFFWNIHSTEEYYENGLSYVNRNEAGCVAVLLEAMFKHGIRAIDIGIITPYAGQQAFLIDNLPEMCRGMDKNFFNELEIASVDAFQGREKNYIILSNVRANSNHDIGFLKDLRRVCVSLTRARYGMIVIGCADTYSQNTLWVKYFEHCKKNGIFVEGRLNNLVQSHFTSDLKNTNEEEEENFAQLNLY